MLTKQLKEKKIRHSIHKNENIYKYGKTFQNCVSNV